mgnify:FL=1
MTVARKAGAIAGFLLALIVGCALWIVATESGTRWLAGRVDDRLPDELSVGTLHGSLLRGIRLESLEWNSDSLHLMANEINLAFELLPLAKRQLLVDSLTVDRLQLEVREGPAAESEPQGGTFSLPIDISLRTSMLRNIEFERGDLQRMINHIAISGDFEGNTLRLARLEFRSDWLDLDLSGTGRLAENVPLDVRANWRWKEQDAMELSGRLEVSGDLASYTVHHDLDAPLSITTTGNVAYADATLDVDLLNEWASLSWPLEQRVLQASPGTLRIAGRIDGFTIDLDTGIRVDQSAESRVRLSGDGRLTPEPHVDLNYAIAGLDPSLLDSRMRGNLDSNGAFALTLPDGAPELTLGIDSLVGQLNDQAVHGNATVNYAGGRTSVSDASLSVGDNSVSGTARIGDTVQVDAEVDFANLAQFVADAGGSVRGRVAVEGSLERPEVEVSLQGADLAWQDYGIARLAANARIEGDQQGAAEVTIEGAAIATSQIDFAQLVLSGRPENHDLRTSVQAYGTRLEIEGRGTYAAPAWTADLQRVDIANEKVGTWSTTNPAQLRLSPDESRLQRTCLEPADGAGQACVGASRNAEATSVDVDIRALPLVALPVAMPAGLTLEGLINASLHGVLTAQGLTAEAGMTLEDASVNASYDGEHVSLRLENATAKASFVDGRLESSAQVALADKAGSAHAQLAVTEAGPDGYPVDGRADIRINDASVFAVFAPSIDDPRGRIEGGLTVAGVANAPEFVGEIAILDGAFSVRQTGIDVTDLNLRIAQSQPGQMRLSGSARSGDGDISIEGITRISQAAGIRSEVWLRGTNFELARLPDWQISVSPSLTAIFDNQLTTVVGELAIPAANVTVRDIPETAATPSSDAVVHRPGEAEPTRRRRIDLHLRTSLGDNVQFAGFGLTTGLEGAVQLRGGTHAPYTGQGRLGLVGGRYEAYGQELEIERGNLIFSGPLDQPLLDIRAVRRTPDVVAGIQLTGTPSRLQSDVFSDPELGDAETLSYLLTGRPLSNSMTSDEGDTLNKAAFALGLSGAGLVTSQIRSQLGLETLTIEGTSEDSRLVAGKRLGDRLLVEYGYGLVDQLGTLLLRYQLNDRLMLESRTGTVSYLDVLYRARKR